MSNNLEATRLSFWQLLEESYITMPLYQRDYVQGRLKDTSAELIRKEFIHDLIEALHFEGDQVKELHFIFGGKDSTDQDVENGFVPVDGQQRLTTLFLIHWYVFLQCGANDNECDNLAKFRYASRDTSRRFCEEMVEIVKKKGNVLPASGDETIRENIRKQTWFTGNIASDPTVDSMLVVLDEIHTQFQSLGEEPDWQQIKKRLMSDVCPVVFLCLDMKDELGENSEIRDLYIKMNARGKLLTDFENFKAYLRKTVSESKGGENFDLLAQYLGDVDDETMRTELLGWINNEYTDFFFQLIDGGQIYDYSCDETPPQKDAPKQCFDIAMMNFFNEMIRMEFFSFVRAAGVNGHDYRSYNDSIAEMSGKEFYHFVTSRGIDYLKRIDEKRKYGLLDKLDEVALALTKGFERAIKLLDILSGRTDKKTIKEICCMISEEIEFAYSIEDIILQSKGQKKLVSLVPSRAIFLFVEKFGVVNNELFTEWSRLIRRCVKYTEIEHFNDVCEISAVFENIVNALPENATVTDLLKAIVEAAEYTALEHHFKEERLKAKLRLSEDGEQWEKVLREAESWHENGQVYYLIELSRQDDEQYSNETFNLYFKFVKNVFIRQKGAILYNGNFDGRKKFENALLLSSDKGPYFHLLKKDKGAQMRFSYNDYYPILSTKNAGESQHQIMLAFIKSLFSEVGDTVQDKLDALYDKLNANITDWRCCLIDENCDLYSLTFNESSKTDTAIYIMDDGYCMLFKEGVQIHKESTELHTAELYARLKSMSRKPYLSLGSLQHLKTEEEYPSRHVVIDDKVVYYLDGYFHIYGRDESFELNDVIAVL